MPRKMARQTLERHAGACCAGSRPYLGSGLLGSPENRYNFPTSEFIRGIPVSTTSTTPTASTRGKVNIFAPTCKCLLDKPRQKDLSDRHGFVA
jgi:hypothetical protein